MTRVPRKRSPARTKKPPSQRDRSLLRRLDGHRASVPLNDVLSVPAFSIAARAVECTPGIDKLEYEVRLAYADRLAEHAERAYNAHPEFARRLKRNGDRGFDLLYAFMQHWFAAMLRREHPEIWRTVERGAPGYGWDQVYW